MWSFSLCFFFLFSWALLCWLNCFLCFIHLWALQVLATRMSPNFRFRGNKLLPVCAALTHKVFVVSRTLSSSKPNRDLVQTLLHSCAKPSWLRTAKERTCLDQFCTVLVWCCKSIKFDRVRKTFVELNLGSTHGALSESDVTPVSHQSLT